MPPKFSSMSDLRKQDENDNNRYVGGQNDRGGGSGLAVEPSNEEKDAKKRMEDILKKQSEESTGKANNSKKITFWKNGFTVDNGPLRTGNTEADAKFMADIEKG